MTNVIQRSPEVRTDRAYADEFEVSVFLTETDIRHSVLRKHKHFSECAAKLQSNSSRLLGTTSDDPVELDVAIREESDDDEPIVLDDVPRIEEADTSGPQRSKRARAASNQDSLFVQDDKDCDLDGDDDDDGLEAGDQPAKRRRTKAVDGENNSDDQDDKEKLAATNSYQGFSIYGRVLCLVVKRRNGQRGAAPVTGQAVMENWLSSTQAPQDDDDA